MTPPNDCQVVSFDESLINVVARPARPGLSYNVVSMTGDLLLLSGLLALTVTLGELAWQLAVIAATASAMRLSLAGRAVRRCVVARQRIA